MKKPKEAPALTEAMIVKIKGRSLHIMSHMRTPHPTAKTTPGITRLRTKSGGHDVLDISAFGISSATFAARVTIAGVGGDTLVTIDGDAAQTIRLIGISDATAVTQADFLL